MMSSLKVRFILILLLLQLSLSHESLPPPKESYNICMLISFVEHSHRTLFFVIARELLERGHKVTVLSSMPPGLHHPNATEITHSVATPSSEDTNMFKLTEEQGGVSFDFFKDLQSKLAKELYQEPSVIDLYARRHEFDLFITDINFNEQTYPFLYEKPFILISTAGKFPMFFSAQGNPLNPAYAPTLTNFPRPWTFFNRVQSLLENVLLPLYWKLTIVPAVQYELNHHFPDIPIIKEIERNVSLIFVNSHFSLDYAAPLLPSQLELAGLQCRPREPLPQDLEDWINGSGENGVVYFSLGSITKGNTMPTDKRDMFIEAFSRLKQRVIWKFEEDLPNKSNNVLIKKWLPQQDIIAHPKVKTFITHGGLLGLQEAIYHSTPLIALPIYGDQPKNCQYIRIREYGICLSWENLTADIIYDSILEILNNQKYIASISSTSKIFKDQPMSPRDSAVFWTEYVIRNKGAPKLRSPAADLSWIEFLMLDVIVLLHLVIFIIIRIIKKVVKTIFKTDKNKSKTE